MTKFMDAYNVFKYVYTFETRQCKKYMFLNPEKVKALTMSSYYTTKSIDNTIIKSSNIFQFRYCTNILCGISQKCISLCKTPIKYVDDMMCGSIHGQWTNGILDYSSNLGVTIYKVLIGTRLRLLNHSLHSQRYAFRDHKMAARQ